MGFDQPPVQALSMILMVEGKQAHDNQNHYDTSRYEVLHHGCHSD